MQWWGIFTSDYKQKARLLFKKEWKNQYKKLDIWKHPREKQEVLPSTIAPTVIVYDSIWKKLLKIYTLILLGAFTKEAIKKCSLLKSCLYGKKRTSPPLKPLSLNISLSLVNILQDTAIRMFYFLFSMHSLRLLVAYLGNPASEQWKKPSVICQVIYFKTATSIFKHTKQEKAINFLKKWDPFLFCNIPATQ